MSASIKEKAQKIKLLGASFWENSKEEIFGSLIIILVAIGGFALGRLSINEKAGDGVKLLNGSEVLDISTLKPGEVIGPQKDLEEPLKAPKPALKASGGEAQVVASKNSTKYHYSYCSGAKRISEANKIYFASASAAEVAGYTLAGNCQAK